MQFIRLLHEAGRAFCLKKFLILGEQSVDINTHSRGIIVWESWNAWIGSLLYNTFAAFVMFTVLATVYDTNQRVRS